MHHLPLIGESAPWCDGALGDSIHTVHVHGVELPNAVPMNAGAAVRIEITDMDLDSIAPACLDPRPWVRFIEDCRSIKCVAVGGDVRLVDSDEVLACFTGWIIILIVAVDVESFSCLLVDEPA